MANSQAQRAAELWICTNWLPDKYHQTFSKQRLQLSSGGVFEFDAVSEDRRIAVSISTSGGITSGGKKASPKMNKIRSDALFLLLAAVQQRIILFTERQMYELCQEQIRLGRFPPEVTAIIAELPPKLEADVASGRAKAAEEIYQQRKVGG